MAPALRDADRQWQLRAYTVVGVARRTATGSGTPLVSASMTRSRHATPVNAGQDAFIACADGSIIPL
jgi:hypothetical protein